MRKNASKEFSSFQNTSTNINGSIVTNTSKENKLMDRGETAMSYDTYVPNMSALDMKNSLIGEQHLNSTFESKKL